MVLRPSQGWLHLRRKGGSRLAAQSFAKVQQTKALLNAGIEGSNTVRTKRKDEYVIVKTLDKALLMAQLCPGFPL